MRAAVTGATGFVGRQVTAELHRQGHEVRIVTRDVGGARATFGADADVARATLDDDAALTAAFRGCDLVVHLAGAVDFSNDLGALRRINVDGTRAVLRAARAVGVGRVVHASSIVAVGASPEPIVLDETAAWTLGPRGVAYVITKREGEQAALAESRAGLDVVVVNPGCVIGPDDTGPSEFGMLCTRFWRGKVPFRFGGGNNFVDVRDVAQGTVAAATLGRPGERYLLGGSNLTYEEFFTTLAQVSGRARTPWRLPNWAGRAMAAVEPWVRRSGRRPTLAAGHARLLGLHFFASSAKAERELGYRPRTAAESLADAFAFFSAHRRAG